MIDFLLSAAAHFQSRGRTVLVTREHGAITAIESFSSRDQAANALADKIPLPNHVSVETLFPNRPAEPDTTIERRRQLLDNPEE